MVPENTSNVQALSGHCKGIVKGDEEFQATFLLSGLFNLFLKKKMSINLQLPDFLEVLRIRGPRRNLARTRGLEES